MTLKEIETRLRENIRDLKAAIALADFTGNDSILSAAEPKDYDDVVKWMADTAGITI